MIVTAGSTNVSVYYYIVQDASATSPGEPVTGLLFSDIETGGSASYVRQGAARTDLTLITLASASAAHSDGGFILVDDTNMPGVYRCDYPDAAFATGVDQVFCSIVIASANNAVAAPIAIDITDVDLRDSVRGGMTSLPNAAADAAGGLPISDAGGLDLDGLSTFDPATDTVANVTLTATCTTNSDINTTAGAINNVLTVATCTTNTDMVGTDNALLASSAPTNFSDLAITLTTGRVDIATNNDKAGYSISGTKTTLDALQDLTAAQVNAECDTAITDNLNITVAGNIGIDWANVENASSIINLSATTFNLVNTLTTYTGNTPQTGDNYVRIGAPVGASISADVAAVKSVVDDLTADDIPGLIAALNDLSAAEVKTQVVAALSTDTYGEPAQGTPPATTTLEYKLGLLYKALRNRSTQTTSQYSLYADNASTIDHKSSFSDDTITTEVGELATGP